SEYAAEDLAADIGGAGLVVRHDAPGRRQNRDAEPIVDARQVGDPRVDPPAGRGDPRDLADHRLTLDVLELDRELPDARAQLLAAVTADVALALQHLKHVGADLRGRGPHDGLVGPLRIPDPAQHIPERIAHRHKARLPYQLDLTMPGTCPVEARSR